MGGLTCEFGLFKTKSIRNFICIFLAQKEANAIVEKDCFDDHNNFK